MSDDTSQREMTLDELYGLHSLRSQLAQVEGSKLVRNMAEEIDYLRSQLAAVKADADRWRGLVELARPGQIVSISEQNGVWEVSRKGIDPCALIDILQLENTPEDTLDAALRERKWKDREP